MKKLGAWLYYIGSFVTFCVVALSLSLVLFHQSDIPQNTLKSILNYQLDNLLACEVEVDRLSGNFLTHMQLSGVKLFNHPDYPDETILFVKEADIYFNPLKLLFNRDPLSIVRHVSLNGVDLSLVRDREDQWNLFKLASNEVPSASVGGVSVPKLSTTVTLNDVFLNYRDEHGWSAPLLEKPFVDVFYFEQAHLSFDRKNRVVLSLNRGIVGSSKSPMVALGLFDLEKGEFDVNFSAGLDLDRWGRYVVAVEGMTLSNGISRVRGRLRSRKTNDPIVLPFWVTLEVDANDAYFRLANLDFPFTNLNGRVILSEGMIPKSYFSEVIPGVSKSQSAFIWYSLQNSGFLDEDGQVIYGLVDDGDLIGLPDSLKLFKDDIKQIISRPPNRIFLDDLKGKWLDVPLTANGIVGLSHQKIDLIARSRNFDLSEITRLFPALANWKLSGKGDTDVLVHGPFSKIDIDGTLYSKSSKYYAIEPDVFWLNYAFDGESLNLESNFSTLFDGDFRFKGGVDFRSIIPTLDFLFEGAGMSINSVFPSSDDVSGNFGFKASLTGDVLGYDTFVSIYPKDLTFFNQGISVADASFYVSGNEMIENVQGRFWLNGGRNSLDFTGYIDHLVSANFSLEGDNVWFKDVMGVESNLFGEADISMKIQSDLVPAFWEKPLLESRFDFLANFRDYPFEDHVFDNVNLKGTLDRDVLALETLLAKNDLELVQIEGNFKSFIPQDITFNLEDVLISNTQFFQKWLPSILKPIGGRVDLSMNMGQEIFNSHGLHNKKGLQTTIFDTVGVVGDFVLREGYVQHQPVERLSSDIDWNGRLLSFDSLELMQGESHVSVNGEMILGDSVSIFISQGSLITMEDFKLWTSPYGEFYGDAFISGYVKGSFLDPDISLDIALNNFSTPRLSVDSLTGNLSFKEKRLSLKDWQIRDKSDSFGLTGFLDMEPFLSTADFKVSDLNYDVQFLIESAEIDRLIGLTDGVIKDFKDRFSSNKLLGNKLESHLDKYDDNFKLESLLDSDTTNYRKISLLTGDTFNSALNFYDSVSKQYENNLDDDHFGLKRLLTGTLSGHFVAKSRYNRNPLVDIELHLNDPHYRFIKANGMDLTLKTTRDDISYKLKMEKGRISGIPFEEVHSEGVFDQGGILHINETEIVSNGHKNNQLINGKIPLQGLWDTSLHDDLMDVSVVLKKNDIALLSFLHPDIKRLFNRGFVELMITGSLEKPLLNSKLVDLTGSGIQLTDGKLIESPIRIRSGDVSIKDNFIQLHDLEFSWTGVDTLDKRNSVQVNGGIDIRGLSFVNLDLVTLAMDLDFTDTGLSLNIPDVYSGELNVENISVSGDYLIGFSKEKQTSLAETIATVHERGPILSGAVFFKNGDISLPKVGKKKVKPSWLLDLDLSVGDDVSVVGGILGDSLLAGLANYLDIRLKPTAKPFSLQGSLNAPKIDEALILDEGSMTFLNRGFELMDSEKQIIFFEDQQFKIQPHQISLKQEVLPDGKLRINPQLTMSAFTIVESLSTENIIHNGVVILINGSIYNLNEIVFEKYHLTHVVPQRGDPEYIKSLQFLTEGSKTDQARETFEVLELLVPEFVGASGLGTNEGTQDILEVVGENQINSYLKRRILRPIERQIAKSVGLHDLRVDYNVGRALIRGTGESNSGIQETDSVGVALVKGLSDNLFLKVRTNLELRPENSNSLENSNVELQYNLHRNLSVSYSNGRERNQPEANPRFSLRYSHEF